MTLEQCYAVMGGDYAGVLGRLGNEARVRKYALKFLSDPNYDALCAALDDGRWDDAFRAAHTIKGVCQNLDFSRLYHSSSALTELLRRQGRDFDELLARVREDYASTVEAIRALDE